jgi:hypothetical protein
MNRIDFISLINNPGKVNLHNIGEIKELIDCFPYFQTAHLLLLKGLYNSSDVKFAGQLLTSSVHIADREVLYYLLNTVTDSGSVEDEINQKNDVEEIRTVKTRDYLTEEIETRLQEIKGGVIVKLAPDQSAIPGDDHNFSNTEESVFELEDGEFHVADDLYLADQPGITSLNAELLSFEYNSDLSVNDVSVSTGQHKESALHPNDLSLSKGKNAQSELIDKFILANPRIEPLKEKQEHSVHDVSKASTEEKSSFVTETLAKIYINQEYYSRAIDIYEKLSLKFPEKSSYFATQIEKIKEIIQQK